VLTSTAGASVTAGNFVVGTQYSVTSVDSVANMTGAGVAAITGFSATIAATTMTVTGTGTGGTLAIGQFIVGGTISANTKITGFITGTGGAGTYTVNNSQTVASSTPFTALNPLFTATDVGTGSGTAVTTTWTSAANNSIGVGQTWTDVRVTPGRASGTTYTNSTGKPIQVLIVYAMSGDRGGQNGNATVLINGISINPNFVITDGGGWSARQTISFIIPNGNTYSFTNNNIYTSIASWLELR